MVIPWDPAHSAATQEFMARVSIGEPAALNTAFRNGQLDAVRANFSGTTIRCFHEQIKPVASVLPKSTLPIAVPEPKPRVSWVWSSQFGGLVSRFPPCAGTMTSEHGRVLRQPS